MYLSPNATPCLSRSASTISQNNPDIMEYLISKLDNRLKQIIKHKQFISAITTFEAFFTQKRQVFNLLSSLEDDIKQASYAIKALLNENKVLCANLAKSEEDKQNTINELAQSNVYLMSENENLKIQISNMAPIKENEYNKCNNNNNNQNVNEYYNNCVNNNEASEQLPNVHNIITDIKYSKNKLKDAIKQHFNYNHNNDKPNVELNEEQQQFNQQQIIQPHQQQQIHLKANDNKNKIILKIMNSPECIKILNERLGNNYLEQILNNKCDEEMLAQINNIISETGKHPTLNYNTSSNNNKHLNCSDEEKPLPQTIIPIRIQNMMNANKKNKQKVFTSLEDKPKKNNYRSLSTSSSQLFTKKGVPVKFEKALRAYPTTPSNDKKKKFMHYTNPYGNYFDNTILNDDNNGNKLKQINSSRYSKSSKNTLRSINPEK